MDEKYEVAREIIPFLEDLIPGVSVTLIVSVVRIVFIAAVSLFLVFTFSTVGWRLFLRQRARHYLKNMPVFSEIDSEFAEEEKTSLREMAINCAVLGNQIDFHTNRRHNSRYVSSLVYKMCKNLGYEEKKTILYTCASMIYDVGFLDIPASVFHTEVLSAKERKSLHAHIMNSYEFLSFIPKEYMSIFFSAAMFHHENYDGSGYPEGLSKKDIPEIAMMIRIVESYVALTARRDYRKVFSREMAISELRRNSSFYSPDFLLCLERVVL